MLPKIEDYDELLGEFRWRIPDTFNRRSQSATPGARGAGARLSPAFQLGTGAHLALTYGALPPVRPLCRGLAAHGVNPGRSLAILLRRGSRRR
ncbi:hypothetical protein F2981_01985 [Sinorhizobium meliloti]|nr:hypothetical protein [Sinorhizobium meliloti]